MCAGGRPCGFSLFGCGVVGLLRLVLGVGVGEFVAGVDRLLTRARGLFEAGAGSGGGEVFAAGGGGGGSVPRRLMVAVVWVVVWLLRVGSMSSRRRGCRGWISIRGRPPGLVVRWLIRAALVRG